MNILDAPRHIRKDKAGKEFALDLRRLVSLYQLMFEIDISYLVRCLECLESLRTPPVNAKGFVARYVLTSLEGTLRDIRKYDDILALDSGTIQQIIYLQDKIDSDLGNTSPEVISSLADSLHESLMAALEKRRFLYVPIDVTRYYKTGDLFGKELLEAFPEAAFDMTEAGNALATGLDTACVFHCMRVAEHALRRIAAAVQVELTDNGKPIPVEFATWEKVLQGIEAKRIEVRKKPKSVEQNRELLFYAGCGDTISYLKDYFRNEIMHVRRSYNEHNAMDASRRVVALLKTLVEGPKTALS